MPTESLEVPLRNGNGLNEDVNALQIKEHVVFLLVKPEAADILSKKLRTSCLESQDYECIFNATTEEADRWNRLLKLIELDPSYPKTDGRILSRAYCDFLVSKRCEYYDVAPKIYDFFIRHLGVIVVAECTKELEKELWSKGLF